MDTFFLIHRVSKTRVQAHIETYPSDNRKQAVYFDNHPHKGVIWTAPDAEGLQKRWEEAGWVRETIKAQPTLNTKIRTKIKKGE
jgi:hypothetical protein